MNVSNIIKLLYIFNLIQQSQSGPITSGACMYACNIGAVACYASLGFVFGTVTAGLGYDIILIKVLLLQQLHAMLDWEFAWQPYVLLLFLHPLHD